MHEKIFVRISRGMPYDKQEDMSDCLKELYYFLHIEINSSLLLRTKINGFFIINGFFSTRGSPNRSNRFLQAIGCQKAKDASTVLY